MIKMQNIRVEIGYTDSDVKQKICNILKINKKDIGQVLILKESIDARKKPDVFYVLTVAVELKISETNLGYPLYHHNNLKLNYKKADVNAPSPVVVGFGPAGLFCALALAKMGYNPIVIEQGKDVNQRKIDVENFWNNRVLNKYSNVQFGEGGAGTFSDGKLNTTVNNDYCIKVLNELCIHGAPKEILYKSKPHIGSDLLPDIIKNIRNKIIDLGGNVMFCTRFVDFLTSNNHLKSVVVQNVQTGEQKTIETNSLILALGHSARDTFEMLYNKQLTIHQKPFAMGVRIEQSQHDINISQYGKNYNKLLPSADYKLVSHISPSRSVFTFCMCPGGSVVASSSNENEVVTNGMSNSLRNGKFANSALLVNVTPSDYKSSHPLAGIYFQAKYEKKAFEIAGKNYNAPAQTVDSFLNDKKDSIIKCTYQPNVTVAQLKNCLPDFVTESLKIALLDFNKKINNFAKPNNVLIGIESRSSCPLTIVRDKDFQSNIKGIFPCGEGAGYAGGIVSSAQDGIKTAEMVDKFLQKK